MKDKRNKILIAGILLVAAIFGFHMLSLVQEPPHVVHEIDTGISGSVIEYTDNLGWQPNKIRRGNITYDIDIDWDKVYKVGYIADFTSRLDHPVNIYGYINPVCTWQYNKGYGSVYSCTRDGGFPVVVKVVGYWEDSRVYTISSTASYTLKKPVTSLGFSAGTDWDEKVYLESATLTVYEEVECTEDSHCVSAAPKCNTGTNLCETVISLPDTPPPSGFMVILQDIWGWVTQIFDNLFYMSILGESKDLLPGDTYTYDIFLETDEPDLYYKDGTIETQYAYWALLNSGGTVIDGKIAPEDAVMVFGVYNISVNITLPDDYGNYLLVATIEQIDSTYDWDNKVWVHGDRYVIVKEATDLNTAAPIPDIPSASGFMQFLSGLWDWFKGLFNWI